ncbi:MAG: DUF3786 domain-containing protein [Anaerolineae bacterium]|nr:DUF3786 domain-containing protein [Anaerolineae bacterium]
MKARTPEEVYQAALQKAEAEFSLLDPTETAARAGVSYTALGSDAGQIQIAFFGTHYHVRWPGGAAVRVSDQKESDVATRLLLLHYLITADGTPMASKWIAFRNLPGGLGYDAAFQRRASIPLMKAFGAPGQGQASFEFAARMLSGERLQFGDAAFCFRLLPRMWLAVVLYVADEEFPASANVLFDAAAEHYLATEDLAVVGGMLAGRLIKAAKTAGP